MQLRHSFSTLIMNFVLFVAKNFNWRNQPLQLLSGQRRRRALLRDLRSSPSGFEERPAMRDLKLF